MNRTTRSTLALLLALCLMMAVFAGCTSKSSAETVNNADSIFLTSIQIVGIENGYLSSLSLAFGTHHPDVAVCDRQDTRTAERSCGNLILRTAEDRMSR